MVQSDLKTKSNASQIFYVELQGENMKYLVVEASSAEGLQMKVQQYIFEGWEPQGGLSVATYGTGHWWYYQAMVKREMI